VEIDHSMKTAINLKSSNNSFNNEGAKNLIIHLKRNKNDFKKLIIKLNFELLFFIRVTNVTN
jgi:hypothetical protein